VLRSDRMGDMGLDSLFCFRDRWEPVFLLFLDISWEGWSFSWV
jgi:hypothetical protein